MMWLRWPRWWLCCRGDDGCGVDEVKMVAVAVGWWKWKKKYEELSVTEKLQADCDLKATNIVLQGLPTDVYAIVNHHKVAKEIWDKVKLLMQGTQLSLQERECKLYDEFDKFPFLKGLAVPVFTQGEYLIACLNKAMAFLSPVAAS
ncbi:hypothetical protein Tco_0999739, partial [Tanacetum coccineum]